MIKRCVELIVKAKRPVLILGNGARGANVRKLITYLQMPVVTSWNGSDLLDSYHPLYIGRMGIFGDYASNYAVQHADLLLAIGTRLSIAQIGHHAALFAPNAKKIIVDIDPDELRKPTVKPDLSICMDAKAFCETLIAEMTGKPMPFPGWNIFLHRVKASNPTMLQKYREDKQGVNAYFFVEQLGKHLADDAIVVTDVGAAFIATMQTLQLNGRQRLFHSGGVSAMGYGFPASIGACRAGGGRQTVCLTGDGGMMLNLQELQTVVHHNLPIKIFVFANNGYMTIRNMQETHFKRQAMSTPDTGLSCPDFAEVGKAFGVPVFSLFTNDEAEKWVEYVLTRKHPMLCVVHLPQDQVLLPRVQSKIQDGKFVPVPLDEMYPPMKIVQVETV